MAYNISRVVVFLFFFTFPYNLLAHNSNEWQVKHHPRQVGDVNGDGRADIIGFGNNNVYVALGRPDGKFSSAIRAYNGFTRKKGGWSVKHHPRQIGDVNGDGRADIIGFADSGVIVALGQPDGKFTGAIRAYNGFTRKKGGWSVNQHPRQIGDVNGDGRTDIIGFATKNTYTALARLDGKFSGAVLAYNGFDQHFAKPHTHQVSIDTLRQKKWSTSSVRGTGHWITTVVELKQKELQIESRIINDNRTKGFTGCSSLAVLDSSGHEIIGMKHRRGVNATAGKGRKTKKLSGSIDLSLALKVGVSNIQVTQWRCKKGWGSRLGSVIERIPSAVGGEILRTGRNSLTLLSKIKDKSISELSSGFKKIGGESAQKIFDDLYRLIPVDEKFLISTLDGLKDYIKNGNSDGLNPLYNLAIAEVERSRAELWRKARPIPKFVIDKMPIEIKQEMLRSRFIEASRVPEISLPSFAIEESKKARAIVMKDVIVFDRVPTVKNDQDLFLWAHEAYHIKQYNELGLKGFMRKFLGNELGFTAAGSSSENSLEIDADIFACSHFPIPNPTYIPSC